MATLLERIGLAWPIFQAPMAGTSTPAMAAAVSNGGALGGIGLAAEGVEGAGRMISATSALTNRPFNVNVFCHRPAIPNADVEARWIARLKPEFSALGAEPPAALREISRLVISMRACVSSGRCVSASDINSWIGVTGSSCGTSIVSVGITCAAPIFHRRGYA